MNNLTSTHRSQSVAARPWWSLDVVIGLAATTLCLLLTSAESGKATLAQILSARITLSNLWLLSLFLLIWAGIHHLFGLHSDMRKATWRSVLLRSTCASLLGSVFFLLFPVMRHRAEPILRLELVFLASAFSTSLSVRSAVRLLLKRLDRVAVTSTRVLIIGSGPMAARAYQSCVTAGRGVQVVGFVDSPGESIVSVDVDINLLGGLDELESVLMKTVVDEVMIALPLRSRYDEIQETIQICERIGVSVAYACHPFRHTLGHSRIEHRPAAYVSWRPSRDVESDPSKRVIDILGAAAALILFSPLLLLTALAIKLTSRGPIFFVQERYGLNKRIFRMFKFRTMVADAEARQRALEGRNEAQGPVFKIKNDPRITPLGKFLRKTSLDELPQFLNVLKGDMSLVGPRPLPIRDVSRFGDAWLMRRFSVKPGLTCLWQVSGRCNTNFDEWIALDLKYIDNWSPLLDLKIIAQTVPAVVRGSGAM